jgi:hypothetical protein
VFGHAVVHGVECGCVFGLPVVVGRVVVFGRVVVRGVEFEFWC